MVLSVKNSKLGAAIPSINLPAGITCRAGAPCRKKCYASRGRFRLPAVATAAAKNLREYEDSPAEYFREIYHKTALFRYVRWHSSGDIPDAEYFAGMVKVARQNRGVRYLAFTKKWELVNEYLDGGGRIPKNLAVVFSAWGQTVPENPYNLPAAYVRGVGGDDVIPENAMPCGGKCSECVGCWQMHRGQSVFFDVH